MDNKEIRIINIIPSKSYAHRAFICDHLAGGSGDGVICSLDSDDITATRNCLKALKEGGHVLLCGESGSTLRFMLPMAGVLGRSVRLEMKGRLAERPMGPLEDELQHHGMTISHKDGAICAEGQLESGTYSLPGSVSSQFITGLLLSLPHLDGDSVIELTSDLRSSAYVDITIDVLKQYGISIEKEGRRFSVPGHQKYQREEPYAVEGDWSQAAFWLAAGVAGSCPVGVTGLNCDSVQGDRAIEVILRSFGANITWETIVDDSKIIVAHPSQLHSSIVDIGEVPDLAPAVAAVAAAACGGPPAIIRGYSSPLSSALRGIPERSSISSMSVYDNSYCSVKPRTSISFTGVLVSSVNRGLPVFLSMEHMSGAGSKTRSMYSPSLLFTMSYRICSPRYDIPIS